MKLEKYQQDKVMITGCLLDLDYFEKNYKLITANFRKQKSLDADSRAIQQIIFTGKTGYLLHSQAIKRNYTKIFQWDNKFIVSKYKANVN